MYLIVGLGNPGDKFEQSRHNIGFKAIDYLAGKLNVPLNKIGFKAVYGSTIIGNEKVILAKPQTYMNLSGECIADFYNYYKMELENIIVIYDDIDLKVGEIRIRARGSAGTHNGMKSIIYQLKSEQFPRVRIGVSPPPEQWDLRDYVLSRFGEDEKEGIEKGIKDAGEAAITIIKQDISTAQQLFNKKPGKNKDKEDTISKDDTDD